MHLHKNTDAILTLIRAMGKSPFLDTKVGHSITTLSPRGGVRASKKLGVPSPNSRESFQNLRYGYAKVAASIRVTSNTSGSTDGRQSKHILNTLVIVQRLGAIPWLTIYSHWFFSIVMRLAPKSPRVDGVKQFKTIQNRETANTEFVQLAPSLQGKSADFPSPQNGKDYP